MTKRMGVALAAMLALIVIMPACGGGGPAGPGPVPTPTATPTVWVLQGQFTRSFNAETGTFGFSYAAPPPDIRIRRMVVRWATLPAGVTVTGRFLTSQDMVTCYNANFVCSAIIPPAEESRDASSHTVAVAPTTQQLFVWVVATGGTSGVRTTVPITVELYSSL